MEKTDKIRKPPVHEDKEEAAQAAPDKREGQDTPPEQEQGEDAAKLQDKMLRLAAEFENYKKRSEREMAEFRKFANESLVKDFLPVLDNLWRAMESAKAGDGSVQQLLEGVSLTYGDMHKVLEKYGVTPIEALGQPFDPAFHQALMMETSEDHPDNTVVKEMQKGYLMKERLIRPSMVVVSQGGKKKEG